MTPLATLIHARIEADGPLRLDRFWQLAMQHPEHGYYRQAEPIGAAGDFITAPEISQLFGEMIGLWALDLWRRSSRPAPVRLIEFGPGRGTLMLDFLRAASLDKGFAEAIRLHLIDSHPGLIAAQKTTLAAAAPEHHETLEPVPAGWSLILANEFFDALPIRQYQAGSERHVGIGEDDRLILVDASGNALAEGPVQETAPARADLATAIAARLVAEGGAALICDYGYAGPASGDTLQALQAHRPVSPLAAPGLADLTAHVDFTALASAAQEAGAAAHGPVAQGTFLKSLGIEARAERLAEKADAMQRLRIATGLARLTGEREMGRLFQALCLSAPQTPIPAGFAAQAA